MKIEIVKSYGLAHNSYYFASRGEAAVIDPRRDCQIYTQLAADDCAKIKYILETHRNEDYVVGSVELKNLTGALIGHSEGLPFKYGDFAFGDGDTLDVGDAKICVFYTPGHTDDSVCYVVNVGGEVQAVFTGDTLFAGSVGRTDLYGADSHRRQAGKLYRSLHDKVLPLGDHVLVYPAHGAGSVCGSGISGQEPTTVGYERETNPYLKLDKEGFIAKSLNTLLVVPRYFKLMEHCNLYGPKPLKDAAETKPLTPNEFEEQMRQQDMAVIDTRLPYAYAGAHIPNTLSMWLGGASIYPGWVLNPSQNCLCVLEREGDLHTLKEYLCRLGFDNLSGYLCGGMNAWQEAGKPIRNFGVLSVVELKEKLAQNSVTLLDVREPHEWSEEGIVEAAIRIPFMDTEEGAGSVPKDKPLTVMCSVGNRSSLALSILEQVGFKNLYNVLGGMTAWNVLGYPSNKEVKAVPQRP
jgi:hydroxyacylglutathione hydrolase